MKIVHLKINNYRGIKSLDWHISSRINCLVGPGDSTKTTILDALELVFSPRWMISFSDSDFYNADCSMPISIQATFTEFPEEFMTEQKYGLFLRGYKDYQIINEPEEGSIPALSLRLVVQEDLEPQWTIVKDSHEPKIIMAKDRDKLCLTRLDYVSDKHLTWSRGSALSRLTGENTAEELTMANRAARKAISSIPESKLLEAARNANKSMNQFGVNISNVIPGLDIGAFGFSASAISLHASNIPLRQLGLGSRRLSALSIQSNGHGMNGITLIDEVELGLEPHRIRQLIKAVCHSHNIDPIEPQSGFGQIFMSTHSPTPILALQPNNVHPVRNNNGTITVHNVPENDKSLLPLFRSSAPALLARKILVCEGATEEGLLRRVSDIMWCPHHNDEAIAYHGVVTLNGGGRTKAPGLAVQLSQLGYSALYFGDSDESICPDKKELESKGVIVVLWPDRLSIEQAISSNCSMATLQQIVDYGITRRDKAAIQQSIEKALGRKGCTSISKMLESGIEELKVRNTIGLISKSESWFKRIEYGEDLGDILAIAPEASDRKNVIGRVLNELENWCYG